MVVVNVFNKMKKTWMSMSTKERIGLVLDAICSIGGAFAAGTVGKAITFQSNKIEKVCVRTMMAGLGIAAGDKASQMLRRDYLEPFGGMLDGIDEKKKEAAAHE